MDTATKQKLDSSKNLIVQKIEEATRYLIGNKIAGKITSVAKSQKKEKEDETGIIIPPEKIQQITDYLRLL